MSRGRLLFPLQVEIARIDLTAATAAGDFDRTFRAPKPGTTRKEFAPIRLQAQVEMGGYERQTQTVAGNVPDSRLTLVFHYRELETKGLVIAGDVLLRVGDRLVAIYNRAGTAVENTIKVAAGGLFATEVAPAGLGLGGRRNLLAVTFDERPKGLGTNP